MGMVAAYQQVAPATLAKLVAKPALLEEFLFPGEDSYAVNGYGDMTVDVSKAGMSAWDWRIASITRRAAWPRAMRNWWSGWCKWRARAGERSPARQKPGRF